MMRPTAVLLSAFLCLTVSADVTYLIDGNSVSEDVAFCAWNVVNPVIQKLYKCADPTGNWRRRLGETRRRLEGSATIRFFFETDANGDVGLITNDLAKHKVCNNTNFNECLTAGAQDFEAAREMHPSCHKHMADGGELEASRVFFKFDSMASSCLPDPSARNTYCTTHNVYHAVMHATPDCAMAREAGCCFPTWGEIIATCDNQGGNSFESSVDRQRFVQKFDDYQRSCPEVEWGNFCQSAQDVCNDYTAPALTEMKAAYTGRPAPRGTPAPVPYHGEVNSVTHGDEAVHDAAVYTTKDGRMIDTWTTGGVSRLGAGSFASARPTGSPTVQDESYDYGVGSGPIPYPDYKKPSWDELNRRATGPIRDPYYRPNSDSSDSSEAALAAPVALAAFVVALFGVALN